MGELSDWIHIDAIQALVHHATAVIAAIFIFGVMARLIAYLIPNGHAKKIVIIIDDVILLAVFALTGWRLLNYMWERPNAVEPPQAAVRPIPPWQAAGGTEALIAECRARVAGDDVRRCLKDRNVQAEQMLQQSAMQMDSEMRALDRMGSAKIGAARSFETAQQAFQVYRETECRWRSMAARSGAAEDAYQACMADLAARRAAQIDELLRK